MDQEELEKVLNTALDTLYAASRIRSRSARSSGRLVS